MLHLSEQKDVMKAGEFFSKLVRFHDFVLSLRAKVERILPEQRRWEMERLIMTSAKPGVTSEQLLPEGELIVSLTSHGRRLYDAGCAIESIMQQTVVPNRLILWIDSHDASTLPAALKRQQERGLEIVATEADIRSYKKLVHCLDRYPNDTVITIDDDCIYDYDLVERLLTEHLEHPDDICAARVHRMVVDGSGVPLTYKKWRYHEKECGVHPLNFATGVGGVLYPPRSLGEKAMDASVFMKLAPTADDVWFYYMARSNDRMVRKIATRDAGGNDYVDIAAYIDEGLKKENTRGLCRNDAQIKAVREYLGL
ncbi:MAG: hypothetical protein NC336_01440 [Clostridium sp.]|nr:hypothetical protein [Clostridium sp.]